MKKRVWLGIVLAILCLSGCRDASAPYLLKEEAEQATEETAALIEKETELKEEYCIYVCGAVNRPGVYKLPAGSRIYEAVLLAGGTQEDACEAAVNQAEELSDGQMVFVPTIEEAETPEAETGASLGASGPAGKVNLNTADFTELLTLPGIGESKASAILAYREEKGRFSSVEEIMDITGIKEGVYSKIKDHITVN